MTYYVSSGTLNLTKPKPKVSRLIIAFSAIQILQEVSMIESKDKKVA